MRKDILSEILSDFVLNLDLLLSEVKYERKYFDTSDIMEAYRKLYNFFRNQRLK